MRRQPMRGNDLRVSVGYQQSAQLNININLRYQRFEADDWALEGVTPTAIPTVLSLGAEPWDDDTLIVGIGFRYKLGE